MEGAAGIKRYRKAMLVDTPICDFGLKAPDFELISHDKKSYSQNGLAGSDGLLNKLEMTGVIALADY